MRALYSPLTGVDGAAGGECVVCVAVGVFCLYCGVWVAGDTGVLNLRLGCLSMREAAGLTQEELAIRSHQVKSSLRCIDAIERPPHFVYIIVNRWRCTETLHKC